MNAFSKTHSVPVRLQNTGIKNSLLFSNANVNINILDRVRITTANYISYTSALQIESEFCFYYVIT